MTTLTIDTALRVYCAFFVGRYLAATDAPVGVWLCFTAMGLALAVLCLDELLEVLTP